MYFCRQGILVNIALPPVNWLAKVLQQLFIYPKKVRTVPLGSVNLEWFSENMCRKTLCFCQAIGEFSARMHEFHFFIFSYDFQPTGTPSKNPLFLSNTDPLPQLRFLPHDPSLTTCSNFLWTKQSYFCGGSIVFVFVCFSSRIPLTWSLKQTRNFLERDEMLGADNGCTIRVFFAVSFPCN